LSDDDSLQALNIVHASEDTEQAHLIPIRCQKMSSPYLFQAGAIFKRFKRFGLF